MTNDHPKRHHPIRRKKAPSRTEEGPSKSAAARARGDARETAKEPELLEPRRERRALSHVGGEVFFEGGNDEEKRVLAHALDVSADEDDVMRDVHGFHSYPARLHPLTAHRLIEGLSKPGGRILDPFCGSGTVVVEGRALGREALGSDLNPLAVELAWLKSRGPTKKLVSDMVQAASRIAEVAEERRVTKSDPHRRYEAEDRDRYPIHVLLELDSIAHGIGQLPKTEISRMLRLVVSSILTKVAHSEGDTTRRKAPRRLPSGFTIQLFHQKAEELAERLNEFNGRIVPRSPRAYVGCFDARRLEKVESDSIDLIVTSPPYPGVYDYLDHHLHRLKWLGLREGSLRDQEIGARRSYRRLRLDEAAERWRWEIGAALGEMRRVLARDGRGVIIVADSIVERVALRAAEQLRLAAEQAGVDITAVASQERPSFLYGAERAFAGAPRMEHVVIFRPGHRPKRPPRGEEGDNSERPAFRDGGSGRGAPRSRGYDGPDRGAPRARRDEPQGHGPPRSPSPRGPRSERAFGQDRDQPDRRSHAKTWDSKPRGPDRPRSKPRGKPK